MLLERRNGSAVDSFSYRYIFFLKIYPIEIILSSKGSSAAPELNNAYLSDAKVELVVGVTVRSGNLRSTPMAGLFRCCNSQKKIMAEELQQTLGFMSENISYPSVS